MVTLPTFLQPISSVTFTVYELVHAGEANGLAMEASLKSLAGSHSYVTPPLACKGTEAPLHINGCAGVIVTTGSGLILILCGNGVVPTQPLADCCMSSTGAYKPGVLY